MKFMWSPAIEFFKKRQHPESLCETCIDTSCKIRDSKGNHAGITTNCTLYKTKIELTEEIKNCLILRLLTLDKCKNCDLHSNIGTCKIGFDSNEWLKNQEPLNS